MSHNFFFIDGSNVLLPNWIELGDLDVFQAILERMNQVPNMNALVIIAIILARCSDKYLDKYLDLLPSDCLKNKELANFHFKLFIEREDESSLSDVINKVKNLHDNTPHKVEKILEDSLDPISSSSP